MSRTSDAAKEAARAFNASTERSRQPSFNPTAGDQSKAHGDAAAAAVAARGRTEKPQR